MRIPRPAFPRTRPNIYPSREQRPARLTTVENLEVAPRLRHLYAHLVENKFIENITSYNADACEDFLRRSMAKIHSVTRP